MCIEANAVLISFLAQTSHPPKKRNNNKKKIMHIERSECIHIYYGEKKCVCACVEEEPVLHNNK